MISSFSRTLRRTSTAAMSLALAGTALFGTVPAQAVSTTINYANCGSDTIYGTHSADVVWDTNAPAKVYVGDPAFSVTATGSAQFNDNFSKHLYWSRVIRSVKGTATVAGTLNQQPGSWPMQFEISKVDSGATSAATIAGDLGQVTVPATPGKLPITLGNFAVDALGSDGMLTHNKKVTFNCVTAETNPVADIVQVVSKSATTLSVTPANAGQPARAIANVTTVGGAPSGTVDFSVGGTRLSADLVNGEAAVDLPSMPSGNWTVTAAFIPLDTISYEGSSAKKTLTVPNIEGTTTVLSLSSATTPEGSPATAVANVSSDSDGSSPSGTVTFSAGGQDLVAQVVEGRATAPLPDLAAGLHNVTAKFTPSDTSAFAPSESSIVQWRVQVRTNTSLSLDHAKVGYQEQARATAVVTASSGTPQGVVTFGAGGTEVTAALIDGRATAELPELATGEYQVTASFKPNDAAAVLSSQAEPQTLTVIDAPIALTQTNMTLGLGNPSPKYGEQVTAFAQLTPGATGTVSFVVNGAASAPVDVNNSKASVTLPRTPAGTHTVVATFTPSPGSRFDSASASRTMHVARASTTSVLQTKATKVKKTKKLRKLSVSATFSSPQKVAVSGRVVMTLKKGAKVVGRKTASLKSGKATAAFGRLKTGRYTVSVAYAGNANQLGAVKTKKVRIR